MIGLAVLGVVLGGEVGVVVSGLISGYDCPCTVCDGVLALDLRSLWV